MRDYDLNLGAGGVELESMLRVSKCRVEAVKHQQCGRPIVEVCSLLRL